MNTKASVKAPIVNGRPLTLSEGRLMRTAQHQMNVGDMKGSLATIRELHRVMKENDDRRWVDEAIAESMRLAADRGDEFEVTNETDVGRDKALRRMSGLSWLFGKGRLTPHQFEAGNRYGDDYRKASEVRVKSCLSEPTGSSDGVHALEMREVSRKRLKEAKERGLCGHPILVSTCDAICGEGWTIRRLTGKDTRQADKMEQNLIIALDFLAKHYGIGA